MDEGRINTIHASILKYATAEVAPTYAGMGVAGLTAAAFKAVYQTLIQRVLESLLKKARELGEEYRPELETAGKKAIDSIVDWDIPGIPNSIEATLDPVMRKTGYDAVESVLDAMFPRTQPYGEPIQTIPPPADAVVTPTGDEPPADMDESTEGVKVDEEE